MKHSNNKTTWEEGAHLAYVSGHNPSLREFRTTESCSSLSYLLEKLHLINFSRQTFLQTAVPKEGT